MSFDLTIEPDGKVYGKIGDSTLKDVWLYEQNPIIVWLGNGMYLIRGCLEGDIVKAEGIGRPHFWLMIDLKGSLLEGTMNTSGSKIGGKDSMFMTVTNIVLERNAI